MVIPGFLALTAFAAERTQYKGWVLGALAVILLIYFAAFWVFRMNLSEARACQHIGEAYLKNLDLFSVDPFDPLRKVTNKDRDDAFKDRGFWLLLGLTVSSAIVLAVYINTI